MEIAILIGLILLLAAIIAASFRRSTVVTVNDQVRLTTKRDVVEQRSFGPLGSLPGATMAQAVPGQVTLHSSWTPTWAVFVGILAFPIGLLLLVLIRQTLVLHVRFIADGNATIVQVSGKARRRVAIGVGMAFDELIGGAVPNP